MLDRRQVPELRRVEPAEGRSHRRDEAGVEATTLVAAAPLGSAPAPFTPPTPIAAGLPTSAPGSSGPTVFPDFPPPETLPERYVEVRVVSSRHETHDVVTLRLATDDPALLACRPGQFVMAWRPAFAGPPISVSRVHPDGFELTISSTNDRYINDAQISQAVAQYLSRVGIKTTVDAMTRSVYFPKRAKREFSFAMGGWSSETGEASSFLQYWVSAFDKEHGLGTSNYGGYDSPEFDGVFKRALVTVDPAAREKLLQQSLTLALADLPSIPLHFESSIWAFRKGLTYEGRADQYTLAMSARPANK